MASKQKRKGKMLGIIEKVKELFKCKTGRKAECELQQEEKPEDKTQEQTGCSEEGGSN
jgi:hypothetical protein